MCGIVGYLGEKPAQDVILQGLRRLEYRGYDSAGMIVFNHKQFRRVRAEGKLVELEKKLVSEPLVGSMGIGHTRWATHGVPSERNAHPHLAEGVTIVHNGIIENSYALKAELVKQGIKFESETDTEVVAHLIAQELKLTDQLEKAVSQVMPRLQGAYAILVGWEKQPETIVAFKYGPPLVLGVGQGEMLIASDVQALLPYTKRVVYLEDGEMAVVKQNDFKVFKGAHAVSKNVVEINWTSEQAEKLGYRHFMLKEIFEQPKAVASAIDPHIDLKTMQVKLKNLGITCRDYEEYTNSKSDDSKATEDFMRTIERVVIVACGTSFYAGMVGEYLIENLAGIPVEIDIASEFRYREPIVDNKTLVVLISQSGETADTLAVLRMMKAKGHKCLSICNVRASTIDREANGHLYMNAGVEMGVASTKALSSTLALLNLLALYLAKIKGRLDAASERKYLEALIATPSQMEHVLAHDKFFEEAAETLKKYRGFLYMARGVCYPIAMEGALKLKELAYMHAEGYAAGEMKHGPLALIDSEMAVIMVVPEDKWYEKTISNLEEAKARGGKVISIGTNQDERLMSLSQHYLAIPKTEWIVNPILALVPLQLLSYHVADALGHDVDQPRNLAKSVTVE